MELRRYLALARKWAFLIVLTVGLAAGSSYYYSRQIPPTYRSSTTLLAGQEQSADAQSGASSAASNYAAAYVILANQPSILQATAAAIHWTDTWQSLFFHVSASTSGGQLFDISATADNAVMAQAIANEVAHQIILQDPVKQSQNKPADQMEFVGRQQEVLKNQIESTQKILDDLNKQALLENDAAKLDAVNIRIATLQGRVDNWQKTYAQLLSVTATGPQRFVTVLAPAPLPSAPVSPNVAQNVLFAALAGLVLAAAGVVLLEYLDNTIKNPEDVQRELNLSTLGAITRIGDIRKPEDSLVTIKHPRSPISEAYRVFRTNLQFSGIENPGGALLVTSAGPAEGKTTTAANLAVALAQIGKRVILVDADLRRPSIHNDFGLKNDFGLTSVFLEEGVPVEKVLQSTAVEGLRVLTSGPIPPNPAEMLDSKKMRALLAQLRSESDMVVLDSPPTLAVADASILGSRCSGAVVVIDSGKTRTEAARKAVETLHQTQVKVVGVLLNKLDSKRGSGYYYYYNDRYIADNSKNNGSGQKHKA